MVSSSPSEAQQALQHTSATDLLTAWSQLESIKNVPQASVANAFVEAKYAGRLVYRSGAFYAYDHGQGIYRAVEAVEIIQQLLRTFGEAITVSDAGNLLRYIQMNAWIATPFALREDLICVANGVLDVATGALGPHSPDLNLLARISVNYHPDAACPHFLDFLNQLFVHDQDKALKIRFLQMWIGYLLIPSTRFQLMVFLLGNGANGKSVLCKVIEALLGSENVSHSMLNRLGRASVRAELAGKLLNISPDLPNQALKGDGYLKSIISGDRIEAERKYQDSVSFTPYARLLVSLNSMAHSSDTSDGFFRRLVIVKFNRSFGVAEQNPHLLNELLEELPGILAWAVAGLRQLLHDGQFSIPPSSLEAVADYRCETNPVLQFAGECLTTAASRQGIGASELFKVFVAWCQTHRYGPGTTASFGRALRALGFESHKASSIVWHVQLRPEAGCYHPAPRRAPAAV